METVAVLVFVTQTIGSIVKCLIPPGPDLFSALDSDTSTDNFIEALSRNEIVQEMPGCVPQVRTRFSIWQVWGSLENFGASCWIIWPYRWSVTKPYHRFSLPMHLFSCRAPRKFSRAQSFARVAAPSSFPAWPCFEETRVLCKLLCAIRCTNSRWIKWDFLRSLLVPTPTSSSSGECLNYTPLHV